jgi:hypothetical protein
LGISTKIIVLKSEFSDWANLHTPTIEVCRQLFTSDSCLIVGVSTFSGSFFPQLCIFMTKIGLGIIVCDFLSSIPVTLIVMSFYLTLFATALTSACNGADIGGIVSSDVNFERSGAV